MSQPSGAPQQNPLARDTATDTEKQNNRCRKIYQKMLACIVQAGKGVEKKGAKLLSIETSAKVKAAQAEAKQEAKAAAKRKRQEDKQAEKAELKRSAATFGPLS